ncbi:hypothetical protein EN871_04070 [bacterium M00.F.Ca.ET.228.01.1.1]|uniref:hypothetical protein n=2 Tax=Pseudomonadota TaxID=1224 RepID=UPI00109242AF|nr:hypothetical protein [Paraburkholderia phenoliruptrix]TGP47988.1 hypothetical protein EN871_04070 [bacterium M00.F.Ca.ET.228.01.1.1]TGS05780.1 hypothetical protein EN834_04070 [bacterium M00.F.Ca.ET.191.01.1.1]TGU10717.1 hypothetical protein EN798_04070 [bacterium M00.F.Ca.ET.155.01.1.1]MBW0445195.1 hypothetical protein [Paraburkholderia phenoliruptrix]MBW9095960.1 hypothetical protein [Paraburkholderia phenoliruptrix]
MSDIAQGLFVDATHPSTPPEGGRGALNAQQILLAHITGLCSGALIILGTTAVVCAAMGFLRGLPA